MRVSQLVGQTLRENPNSSEIKSVQLLIRAGFIRQMASGIYSYLPLALRSMNKIESILRQEMDKLGGQEVKMPVVQPAELWQESGRWELLDQTLVRFKDRRSRDFLLSMTHEECMVDLIRGEVKSYKQLPLLLYQIQTKFRDELRPRAGLIRTREFNMKDSYSLDRDIEGLEKQYRAHFQAYLSLGKKVGLSFIPVESDSGIHGGVKAHEFMYLCEDGEDRNLICSGCNYAANREVARYTFQSSDERDVKELQDVHTPDAKTIKELTSCLNIEAHQIAKSTFFMAEIQDEWQLIIAIVHGDREVNETQLSNVLKAKSLRAATHVEIENIGAIPGFASPVGIVSKRVKIIVDHHIKDTPNLVMGANKPDYHLLNVNLERDYMVDAFAYIALASDGDSCMECQSKLEMRQGIEVGNIFQLGTYYSEKMKLNYRDSHGNEQPVVMGSYGIGVGRLLACIAEEYHDQHGLKWPITVAPYEVYLLTLGENHEVLEWANQLYQQLKAVNIAVLFDDRNVKAGVKFKDADLRGMPLRVTISERNLNQGMIELKGRDSQNKSMIEREEALATIQLMVQELYESLA